MTRGRNLIFFADDSTTVCPQSMHSCVWWYYIPHFQRKRTFKMSLLYTGLFLWEKKLIITKLIAQFTVTGRNEVKVELVLIQPFMFWYVYYFVLILTSIFKQNLHLKKMEFCIKTRSTSAHSWSSALTMLSLMFTQRLLH